MAAEYPSLTCTPYNKAQLSLMCQTAATVRLWSYGARCPTNACMTIAAAFRQWSRLSARPDQIKCSAMHSAPHAWCQDPAMQFLGTFVLRPAVHIRVRHSASKLHRLLANYVSMAYATLGRHSSRHPVALQTLLTSGQRSPTISPCVFCQVGPHRQQVPCGTHTTAAYHPQHHC